MGPTEAAGTERCFRSSLGLSVGGTSAWPCPSETAETAAAEAAAAERRVALEMKAEAAEAVRLQRARFEEARRQREAASLGSFSPPTVEDDLGRQRRWWE